MKYRKDIDGLRAIAVMSVIAFHTGISALSGGYIGVDVFFVISGYLITTLIYKEIEEGSFTFGRFYKRRAARLLPALSITLFVALIFGFVFYNNTAFDNLGKELFFSSFGAANILYAQGINYFTKNEAYQPLIHLWSLGVEEQFYIAWPVVLLLTFRLSKRLILPTACLIFIVSLALSISAVGEGLTKGYFLLHYRAFELLVGVITALFFNHVSEMKLENLTKQVLSWIGLSLLITPMFILDINSDFPGFNALWPCIGAALVISFPSQGVITNLLSHKIPVFIGLISYPLYLFHQPIISFIYFFNLKLSHIETFLVVTSISVWTSWLTYKFVENPIRRIAHSPQRKVSSITLTCLCATIPFFAVSGLLIAKSNGMEERFRYLNPFALEISQAHSTTFHKRYERGFQVSSTRRSAALFVGDSVLQHYVLPIKLALDLDDTNIDTVTRGGCVLLKDTHFVDKYSDISCNDIRDKLYSSIKTYDYVIISQAWESYDTSVVNFSSTTTETYGKWSPLLDATVEHFLTLADEVIIIGGHPSVDGTMKLQPSMAISKVDFLSDLKNLTLSNRNKLEDSREFFARYKDHERIRVIEPYSIFCNEACTVNDNNWSYFSDSQHISSASTSFVKERIVELLGPSPQK